MKAIVIIIGVVIGFLILALVMVSNFCFDDDDPDMDWYDSQK